VECHNSSNVKLIKWLFRKFGFNCKLHHIKQKQILHALQKVIFSVLAIYQLFMFSEAYRLTFLLIDFVSSGWIMYRTRCVKVWVNRELAGFV